MEERFLKNKRGWKPTKDDYLLAFRCLDDGYWREISGNIPEYSNMILADYLDEIDMNLPDDCIFCRVRRTDEEIEFKQYSGIIYISYKKLLQP